VHNIYSAIFCGSVIVRIHLGHLSENVRVAGT